jgi:hypothetical protein
VERKETTMSKAELKKMETETLKQMRTWRKDHLEALAQANRWAEYERYHETHICPLNDELMKRGVW